VSALLILQAVLALRIVHRESLTYDEGDHSFAGYMMWKTGDYGLNPEHPPLAKLLATAPLLRTPLWVPPLQGRDFKTEAYLDGRDWLARNDGASQHLLFRMRASVELLAVGLALVVFLATRRWFGNLAALIALALIVFDPNILTNSALVTTDIGVSLFFVASIFAFYRYVVDPGWPRLALAGLMLGLLLATKHSGVLIAPMLVAIVLYELWRAAPGTRIATLRRLSMALLVMTVIGVFILWSFYGFRYAARPHGLVLSTSLADYAAPLSHFDRVAVLTVARMHLLPESYLMGLVDVKRQASFYPTFVLGRVYAHGVWWYFPIAFLIKTTLGLMAMLVLAIFALATGKLKQHREVFYVLAPAAIYFAIAMASGMNIGARHLLPVYALLTIFAAAGAARLSENNRAWAIATIVLLAAHIISSMTVFPNEMAYANEAAGGPSNVHRLLSDANVDWAQQLLQVKQWQDAHPNDDCWFAYFAHPVIEPAPYGIHCHALPTPDSFILGGSALVPPEIKGTILISAGDLSGCEWPSSFVNPFRDFQPRRPDEVIDHAVFVYRGDFDTHMLAAQSRAERSAHLLSEHQPEQAFAMAQDAVRMDPGSIPSQTILGDAAAALGKKSDARQAYEAAIATVESMDESARAGYLNDLKDKLAKVQ
jgi:hypothetical protein